MQDANYYTVLCDSEAKAEFSLTVRWTDIKGESHTEQTTDPDYALTLLELFNGKITLEDLKP